MENDNKEDYNKDKRRRRLKNSKRRKAIKRLKDNLGEDDDK